MMDSHIASVSLEGIMVELAQWKSVMGPSSWTSLSLWKIQLNVIGTEICKMCQSYQKEQVTI